MTKPKPSIPEDERRARGQVQVKVRMSAEQLKWLRKLHGKPGDSAAMVLRRAAGLLLVAVMLCACGGRLEGWDPPPDATEVELAALTSALEGWCDATDGQRCDVLVRGGANQFRIADIPEPMSAGKCTTYVPKVGHARSVITLDNRRHRDDWPEYARAVALHELGHHFRENEGHLVEPTGVLYPCTDVARAIGNVTADDVSGELVDVGKVRCE